MILQPGYTVTRNEQGGFAGSATYYIASSLAKAKVDSLPPGLLVSSFDSGQIGIDYPFLGVSSVSIGFEEAGITAINITFAGAFGPQYEDEELTGSGGGGGGGAPPESSPEIPVPSYRIEARIAEVPISDHPKFRALDETAKFVLGKLIIGDFMMEGPDGPYVGFYDEINDNWRYYKSGSSWYELTGDTLEFAKRITRGEVSYRGASISYIESTQGTSPMTPAQLNRLGKKSTPRGNPPTVVGRDWMLVSASQDQRGVLYQTNIEWELSPNDDGFDPFLYQ